MSIGDYIGLGYIFALIILFILIVSVAIKQELEIRDYCFRLSNNYTNYVSCVSQPRGEILFKIKKEK